jgi:hypothetical protein
MKSKKVSHNVREVRRKEQSMWGRKEAIPDEIVGKEFLEKEK